MTVTFSEPKVGLRVSDSAEPELISGAGNVRSPASGKAGIYTGILITIASFCIRKFTWTVLLNTLLQICLEFSKLNSNVFKFVFTLEGSSFFKYIGNISILMKITMCNNA